MMPSLIAAFALGFMGSGHCLGMCGGIVSALSFAQEGKGIGRQYWLTLGYHFGRLATYGFLGGLAATLTGVITPSGLPIARTFAGIILLLLGFHFLGRRSGLLWLERIGQGVWRWLKPIATVLMPVNHPFKAIVAGAIWGWLPCGLVYAALAYATVQNSFFAGALVMLAFGSGTLPALLVSGLAARTLKQWLSHRSVRFVIGAAYIVFGLWTLFFAWFHVFGHQHGSVNRSSEHEHHHHLL